MKWWLDRLGTVLMVLLVIYLVANRLPGLIRQWRLEGQTVQAGASWMDLQGVRHELKGARTVLVFWATWCGPCTLELDRLKKSVESGDLPGDSVVAISLGEEPDLVARTALERGYSFKVGVDVRGDLAGAFGVEVTPTVVFLDENLKVAWVTSGVSPTLTMRAKNFFSGRAENAPSPKGS